MILTAPYNKFIYGPRHYTISESQMLFLLKLIKAAPVICRENFIPKELLGSSEE